MNINNYLVLKRWGNYAIVQDENDTMFFVSFVGHYQQVKCHFSVDKNFQMGNQ